MKYRVRIPDFHYWQENIGCRSGCPVHTDARAYVVAISEGRYLDAYRAARANNPFASTCARICGAPCEASCARGNVDAPVSIRSLKRFVTEQYGVESANDAALSLSMSAARGSSSPQANGQRVAIVGAGCAGLSCAHDLARLGYQCSVFERLPYAGGQLASHTAPFRYSREVLASEIDAIKRLGVDLHLGVSVGQDVTISELLSQGFAAVFVAGGLSKPAQPQLMGAACEGVLQGHRLLQDLNEGLAPAVGDRCAVLALERPVEGNDRDWQDEEALDVARCLLRLGAREVTIISPVSQVAWRVDPDMLADARTEGCRIVYGREPLRIESGAGGRAEGVWTAQIAGGDEQFLPADTIIVCAGSVADPLCLAGLEVTLPTDPGGLLPSHSETKMTAVPGVFAGGSMALGRGMFIYDIADGQAAARGIDEFLSGRRQTKLRTAAMTPIPIRFYEMPPRYDEYSRQNPPVYLLPACRGRFDPVEVTYAEQTAQQQGARCLKCHINTIFDSSRCTLCGRCVDICPTSVLKLVPMAEVECDDAFAQVASAADTAILKDDSRCIRCGLCAKVCPGEAITMESFDFEEECVDAPG